MKERMGIKLYDVEFVRMNNPPKEIVISKSVNLDNIIESYKKVEEDHNNEPLIQSGIIDGLKKIIDFSTREHEKNTRARLTGRRIIDNRIKKDVKNYYEVSIQIYANEIVSHINGLINVDEFPPDMFRNYKVIKRALDIATGMKKDSYLVDLYILAKSMIPKEVMETEQVIVEPSFSNSSDVAEV